MSTIPELEQRIEQLQKHLENRELVHKLYKNREFKKLILDEFCVQECARYAQASADPSLGKDERSDALAIAQAAGHLRRFLSVMIQMGNQAEHEINDSKELIEQIRREEV